MTMNLTYELFQSPEPGQTARDIGQQVREQIQAARTEALAARKGILAAQGGGVAGTTPVLQIPFDPNNAIPPQAVDLGIAFFLTVAAILLGFPIARAIARRMDRGNVAQKLPPEVSTQLAQLSQAVDAIALEVERISEGQRFTTRLLSEQQANASRTLLAPVAGGPAPGS
jgi:hypothetical protein